MIARSRGDVVLSGDADPAAGVALAEDVSEASTRSGEAAEMRRGAGASTPVATVAGLRAEVARSAPLQSASASKGGAARAWDDGAEACSPAIRAVFFRLSHPSEDAAEDLERLAS